MRTTLVIKDELFVSAKKLAAEKGCSMSALVSDALRSVVNGQGGGSKDLPEYRVPTFEGKGTVIDSQPGEFRQIEEEDELASFKG